VKPEVTGKSSVKEISKEPTPKPVRGRRGVKGVQSEDIALSDEVPEVEDNMEVNAVEKLPTPKPSRGRKRVKTVEPEVIDEVSTSDGQIDVNVIDKEQTSIGRRGVKNVLPDVPLINHVPEEDQTNVKGVAKEPTAKPTRGRRGALKPDKQKVETVEPEVRVGNIEEDVEEISPSQNDVDLVNEQEGETEGTASSTAEPETSKPTRSRRGAKINVETTVEPSSESKSKPTRGKRKGKVEPVEDSVVQDSVSTIIEPAVDEPQSKPTRGRTGKAEPVKEVEVEDEVPKPTSRKGKASKKIEEFDISTPAKKLKTSSRKVKFEDEVEVETTDSSPVLKPARAGRAASKAANDKIANNIADMANIGKKKRRPDSKDRSLQETSTSVPVSRRGGKRKAEVEAESSPPKRATRGRK